MTTWVVRAGACALLLIGMLASGACGGDEPRPLFVVLAERELQPGANEFIRNALGCIELSRDSTGQVFRGSTGPTAGSAAMPAGLTAPPSEEFSVERLQLPRGLRVTVSSGEALLASKLYTIDFLETQITDVIDVTTSDGARHQLAHRGARSCDESVDLFPQAAEAAP